MSFFRDRTQFIPLVLIILSLIGYCLPWIINPGTSLSLGGYDLAEWTSLHASVRGSSPALLTTLLLRLPICCVSIIVVVYAFPKRPGLRLVAGLVLAIALLPPLEFFTQVPGDTNYQQQFVLAGLTGFINLILVFVKLDAARKPLVVFVSLLGIGSSLLGLVQVHSLMSGFGLPTVYGWGGFVAVVGLGLIGITVLKASPLKQTR